nr:MAG: hypothetical protein DIU59_15115 [Pseudomonadota bacterium]
MALPSYMSRREGRYYLQIRLARPLAKLAGVSLFRVSLRTSDYRQARLRLAECLVWVHRMNEIDDAGYAGLFRMNIRQLREYVADALPLSEERLGARRIYEEMLKNLIRRAKAAGHDPDMVAPGFRELFERFVLQNVEAEEGLRRAERIREYERGRADVLAAIELGVLPQQGRPVPGYPSAAHIHATGNVASFSPTVSGPALEAPGPTGGAPGVVQMPRGELVNADKTSDPVHPQAPLRFSDALAAYVEADEKANGNADARSVVKLVVQFIIDKMDDPLLSEFDEEAAARIDAMLPDIPDRKNIPREHVGSLAARYDYAQKHGWDGLKRLTEARLKNGYHNALSRFFGWLIQKKLYLREMPRFSRVSDENLVSLERDAFSTDEVSRIFSLPLFTGCLSAERIWVEGRCLVQNHLYWGYVMSFLTGVRPGELGQIELDDIEEEHGIYYLQLRAFDPKKGRVARKEVKRFKTPASQRTIPLHPLILDLGLLERIEDLRSIGCPVLFPEWEPYPKPGGEMRWGQPLTKSFQYLRRKIGLDRFDVALYSSRHWFAQLIDETEIKDATRRKVMGHSGGKDVATRYGRKRRLTTRDLSELVQISSPEIDEMGRLLLSARERADRGELTVLKPWLTPANWSNYYKRKLLGQ